MKTTITKARHGTPGISARTARLQSAFTMVEIAISLAVIGVALVAIIGVLPSGMIVQRENRERTIINQDATVFMEAIRNGAVRTDDLTNYVYLITNTYSSGFVLSNFTSGAQIIGLLSAPEFVDANFQPTTPATAVFSNRMVAYVHSLSGPAVEKPPQDNSLLLGGTFTYRLICENLPVALNPNALNSAYGTNLTANLHEIRLTFLWPQLPNGDLASIPARQTFRTTIAGQLVLNTNLVSNLPLYFFQPQSFATNAP